MTEIRFPHPYTFTSPSCVWTSWNTCFSLCPGCLCGICNMTNINIHQYMQWFVREGVPNVPTAYIATFFSRLLMSLSKGLFAWALMRHSWAVWYSCSSMWAWQRWHRLYYGHAESSLSKQEPLLTCPQRKSAFVLSEFIFKALLLYFRALRGLSRRSSVTERFKYRGSSALLSFSLSTSLCVSRFPSRATACVFMQYKYTEHRQTISITHRNLTSLGKNHSLHLNREHKPTFL